MLDSFCIQIYFIHERGRDFTLIYRQERTQDFHLGGAVYGQVKRLNEKKSNLLRAHLRGFLNHAGVLTLGFAPVYQC